MAMALIFVAAAESSHCFHQDGACQILRFHLGVESSFSKAHCVVRKETTWRLVQRHEDADNSHEGDL